MDRSIAPEYRQAEGIDLRFPEEIELQNGVMLYHFKDVKDESVKLDISWNAGTKYQSTILQASFTNKLLFSGTQNKTAQQISEEVDFYGGYFQKNIDKDHAGITLYGLTETIPSIFSIISEAIENCEIPESEFKKEVEVSLNHFRIESEKVKTLCRRQFSQSLFGSQTAYGAVASEEDFHALRREDLSDFLQSFYHHNRPTLFLCGQVSDSFIKELRDWSGKFPAEQKKSRSELEEQEVGAVHQEQEGAIQSAIRIGRRMFDKNHPDYFPFQLLNTVTQPLTK